MITVTTPALFRPINIASGRLALSHRIAQRASTAGTLLVTEATFIAARTGGYNHIPGIWSEEQLWALGRAAEAEVLAAKGHPFVAPSDVGLTGSPTPRPLTVEEIMEYVGLYVAAATNAIRAGFDGVEIHCGGRAMDEYGGSVENRARFPLEVIAAVAEAIGAERVGARFSPWNVFQGTHSSCLAPSSDPPPRNAHENPIPTFSYIASSLAAAQPKLSYLHVVEPRAIGDNVLDAPEHSETDSNDFIRDIWTPSGSGRVLISAGGYTRQTALARAEGKATRLWAVFPRECEYPDLPLRLLHDIPTNAADRSTFYKAEAKEGYTTYPFSEAAGDKGGFKQE
ncbi:hypothetical protein MKEN_00207200 [Mycena kentingensis (nom. inval.)]|nr:hypothetical protein MKEN_00207200 [Mycena kentingensis (nom. inval.)]